MHGERLKIKDLIVSISLCVGIVLGLGLMMWLASFSPLDF